MIIQSLPPDAEPNAARFLSTNVEHAALARGLAEAFGNGIFEGLYPREDMLYVVEHHDHGWSDIDANPPLNPEDGLPYHLVHTPIERLMATSSASPDFNERHSPQAGLLSSMHSYGLYHGRYGLSDKIAIDGIPPRSRGAVAAVLEGELARQRRLKRTLAGTEWADEALVMWNYKLLQFFDTAALYFNMAPPGHRGDTEFHHVPLNRRADVTVQLCEREPGVYAWSPYPFRKPGIELACAGRWLKPGTVARDGAALMASAPVEAQRFRMVAG